MDATPSRPRPAAAAGTPARHAATDGQGPTPPAAPTYTSLPAHLRTWPRALPATNEPGFADEGAWMKEVGGKVGVEGRAAMREGLDDGTLPAVRLGDLQQGMVTLSGQAAQRLVLARDPQAAQPDPGPLRAQVFARVGGDVVSVPTRATTRLLDTEELRSAAAQRAIAEALPLLGGPKPSTLRLAWLSQTSDEAPRVRMVEYRDADGKAVSPGPREDLESTVARIDRTPRYTLDDLRRDTALKVLSASAPGVRAPAAGAPAAEPSAPVSAAPAPAQRPAAPAGGTAAPRPEVQDQVSAPQTAPPATALPGERTAAPGSEGRAPAAPAARAAEPHNAFADAPASPFGAYQKAMEQSLSIDGSAKPTATTAHAFALVKGVRKLMTTAVDGVVEIPAGIHSNYPQLLGSGTGKASGQMGPGSKIILAEREGDTVRILGHMPYAGVRPGTPPAARLLGRADQAVAFDPPLELSMQQMGMAVPNYPFAISKTSMIESFKITPEVRRNLWFATHRMAGWPTE